MKPMIAMINLGDWKKQVDVETVHIGFDGAVHILAKDGLTYETHLSNVLLISQEGEGDTK